jgi:hypothetical protein
VPTGAVLQVANALDTKQRLSDQLEVAEQLSAISRAAETAWLALAPVNRLRIFRRRYAPSRNRNQIFGGRFIACVVTAGRCTAGLAA